MGRKNASARLKRKIKNKFARSISALERMFGKSNKKFDERSKYEKK